jgi:hypothetical protein
MCRRPQLHQIPSQQKANPSQGGHFDSSMRLKWLVTLAVFQCLLLMWLFMLVKAVNKAIFGAGLQQGKVEDQRSEDEQSDVEEDRKIE